MAEDQHLYKVIVVGDYAVGKTSIIKRYTEGVFTPHYKLTIGVDFAVKVVDWTDDTKVSLQVRVVTPQSLPHLLVLTLSGVAEKLWDVAGHERFGTCCPTETL